MKEYARPVAYIRRSTVSRGDPGDQSKDFQLDNVRRLAGEQAPMIGRNDRTRELDLRPKAAAWRKGPLIIPPPERDGAEVIHVHHGTDSEDGDAA